MTASASGTGMAGDGVCVVMPTYNERENLRTTLDGVFAYNPDVDVLIVDDASPDGTGELAEFSLRAIALGVVPGLFGFDLTLPRWSGSTRLTVRRLFAVRSLFMSTSASGNTDSNVMSVNSSNARSK